MLRDVIIQRKDALQKMIINYLFQIFKLLPKLFSYKWILINIPQSQFSYNKN